MSFDKPLLYLNFGYYFFTKNTFANNMIINASLVSDLTIKTGVQLRLEKAK